MPCQDNVATTVVDDVSVSNNNGFFASHDSSFYSFLGGPGGTLTRAFQGSTLESSGDFVTIPTPITIISGVGGTVEFFAKVPSSGTYGIIGEDVFDGYGGIYFSDSALHVADIVSTDVVSVTIPTGGAWHHYAVTLNVDSSATVFVDAVSYGFLTGAFENNFTLNRLGIYTNIGSYIGNPFCGVRVYDTIRTQPQILTDAQIGGLGNTATGIPITNKFLRFGF